MKMAAAKSKRRECKKQVVIEHEEGEEEGAKWVTHYCSDHQILLVGEGDFSFSLCLAKAFGSASNIVASSLDTYGDVIEKYKHAKSNLDELQKLGACLLHGVDATKMKFHSDLKKPRFDRVIFNFPHAGFYGKEDNLLVIEMHKGLVLGFFKNASRMLRTNGEIHVNHKTTYPFNNWNIEELAMQSFLTLIERVDFKKEDYPRYYNKRGGSKSNRCDEPFPLGKCSTFKFIYNPIARKNHLSRNHMEVSRQQANLPFQEIQKVEQLPQEIQKVEQLPASRASRLGRNHMGVSRQQANLPFQEIQKVEQLPAPRASHLGRNQMEVSRQQANLPFQEIQKVEQLPASRASRLGRNHMEVSRQQANLPFQEIHKLEQLPQEIQKVEQLQASRASRLGRNHMEVSRQQANLPFQEIQKLVQLPQEIQKVEQLRASRASHLGRNHMEVSRQQANLPFQEIQKVEQLPASRASRLGRNLLELAVWGEIIRRFLDKKQIFHFKRLRRWSNYQFLEVAVWGEIIWMFLDNKQIFHFKRFRRWSNYQLQLIFIIILKQVSFQKRMN